MLIVEPIIKNGLFFSPSKPEEKYPGTLAISHGGKVELEITTSKVAFIPAEQTEIGRLLGEVEGGGVTLDNCFYRTMSLGFGAPGKSKISAQVAFDGLMLEESSKFKSMCLSIDGLSEWFGKSAFSIQHGERFEDSIISINPLEAMRCVLGDGTELKIVMEIKIPGRIEFPEINLYHQAYIVVTPSTAQSFDFYQRFSHQFARLLSFMAGKSVAMHPLELTLYSQEEAGFAYTAKAYFRSLNGTEKAKFSREDMLLTYPQIKDRAEALISAWFSDYDLLRPALHHHHSVQEGNHPYADTRFLAIAQALEAFHRRTSNTKRLSESDYKKKRTSILDGCPPEHRAWLKEKLSYANEISLADRLHALIDQFSPVFGDEGTVAQLVRSTVATRNYHAHYDPKGEAKAARSAALVSLTYRLRALFALSLLVRLGYTPKEAAALTLDGHLLYLLNIARSIDS